MSPAGGRLRAVPGEQVRAWAWAAAGGVGFAVTCDSLGRKGQARAVWPRQAHRVRPAPEHIQAPGRPCREACAQSSPFQGNKGPGGGERPPFLMAVFFLPCLIQRADFGEQVALVLVNELKAGAGGGGTAALRRRVSWGGRVARQRNRLPPPCGTAVPWPPVCATDRDRPGQTSRRLPSRGARDGRVKTAWHTGSGSARGRGTEGPSPVTGSLS